jgi:hypothetical protein
VIRLVRWALAFSGFAVGVLVIGSIVAVGLVLAESSEIKACPAADGTEAPVSRDASAAAEFQLKLLGLLATLASGEPATASFTNDEVSARVTAYVEAKGAEIDNVTVCFEPERTLVSATFTDILGRDLAVRFEGEVDLSGEHPRVRVDDLKAGKLPLPGPVRELVEERFNEVLQDIQLDHRFEVSFDYGVAHVEAQPGRE